MLVGLRTLEHMAEGLLVTSNFGSTESWVGQKANYSRPAEATYHVIGISESWWRKHVSIFLSSLVYKLDGIIAKLYDCTKVTAHTAMCKRYQKNKRKCWISPYPPCSGLFPMEIATAVNLLTFPPKTKVNSIFTMKCFTMERHGKSL